LFDLYAAGLPSNARGAGELHSESGRFRSGSEGDAKMVRDHGPQIKDDERYEALRRQGASKEKAARIANTSRSKAGKRGGKSLRYEDWKKDDLYKRAKEIGIEGCSGMSKGELIHALRNH
jgi:hypothetical protein